MLNSRLGIKNLPTSIFKLATEEDDSCAKLRDLVSDFTSNSIKDNKQKCGNKIEIRLLKNVKKSPKNQMSSSKITISLNDKTRSKFDNSLNQKEVFDSK